MKQILETEQQIPEIFTYQNSEHTYSVEVLDTPFLMSPIFDFVWDANKLEKEVAYIIETWNEPLRGQMLILSVCLINILAESPCLLLTSHYINVVMV